MKAIFGATARAVACSIGAAAPAKAMGEEATAESMVICGRARALGCGSGGGRGGRLGKRCVN